MKRTKIIKIINEYIPANEKGIVTRNIETSNLTFANLRDRIIGLGTILEESFEDSYYVVSVPAGFANKNSAIVLVLWNNNGLTLFSYAREGIINQHTADKAIDKVIDAIV
jgi:hypothetical protein